LNCDHFITEAIIRPEKAANKILNPTPESVVALRGRFLGGAG